MPSVGMPSSKTPGSTCEASSSYTDAGPPLRMSAYGLRARTAAGEIVCPTSSEYTRHSRTRRAISCEYWPPRSRTRTGRSSRAGSSTTGAASAPIVRRLLRDRHVVRMRLAETGCRDPDEARPLHLLDRGRPAVPHRLAQPTDELVHDVLERALVRNTSLDPFRDQLLDILDVALEVAVLREATRLHRSQRSHAAVLLEALALEEDHVPGCLVGAREHAPEHDRVGTRCHRLRDVARRR